MKRWFAVVLALTLVLSPAAVFLPASGSGHQVLAKGYRTGIKTFQPSTRTGTHSFFKNKTIQRSEAKSSRSFGRSLGGGFMRGMIFGGLSGLLFGSLLSHFGGFGMMAGFLINILAVLAIIALIRYLFVSFTRRRRAEDDNPWRK
ncbi:MAG: hypothetical protein ABF586_05555 [Sporolactobacillus sp.]